MKNFKRTAWSDQQVDLLKKFYGDLSIDDLTTMLGKTKSAIYSKVHYLRKRGWTFDKKRDIKVRKTTPPHAMTSIHKDKTKGIPRKAKYYDKLV